MFEAGSFQPGAPGVGNSFRIEGPLYNQQQGGTINVPPGVIDEAGGVHADAQDPIFFTGAGANVVFSARFRANNPGEFRAFGDPADRVPGDGLSPDLDTRVIIVNVPNAQPNELIELSDEQVFIRSPGPLSIAAPGAEAEFSNMRNPLDVNDDNFVSPSDALSVINTLNNGGSRQVSQYALAASSLLPQGFVDVDSDGYVSPIDALMVINHLNGPGGEGEGEPEFFLAPTVGEGEAEGESGEAFDDSGAAAALMFSVAENVAEGEVSEGELCDLPLPQVVRSIFHDLADHLQSLVHTIGQHEAIPDEIEDLISDVVDDLFARLSCEDLCNFDPFGHQS